MTMDPIADVDPFLGNGLASLPALDGLAAKWFWPKAQVGNTHPGACLPNQWVSVCPYTGGYPTGYGHYGLNTHGVPSAAVSPDTLLGFSHLHPSGTGAIAHYANLMLVTPLVGDLRFYGQRARFTAEEAEPGWYRCRLPRLQTKVELTVAPNVALHRYRMPEGSRHVVVDLTGAGLQCDALEANATAVDLVMVGSDRAEGSFTSSGVTYHVHLHCRTPVARSGLWRGDPQDALVDELTCTDPESLAERPAGLLFSTVGEVPGAMELRIGWSLTSVDDARARLDAIAGSDFPSARRHALKAWNGVLGRIEVEGGDPQQRVMFGSALYHSCLKPVTTGGVSPFAGQGPFWTDFATWWDQYKTTLPLLVSLRPEVASELVMATVVAAEHHGEVPVGYLLWDNHKRWTKQAAGLWHLTLFDAWVRGIEADWSRALDVMLRVFTHGSGQAAMRGKKPERITHLLDLTQAAWATVALAEGIGRGGEVAAARAALELWRQPFDPANGLLSANYEYYEGTHWNYSFRLLPDMAARIALCGGPQGFIDRLDQFFGFTASDPLQQPGLNPDDEFMELGYDEHRFEGLTNEPDMEAPYAYIWAGRHDRCARVVRSVMRHMFTTGRGGLPGNDDSGGLSAWFTWSALGLFPVAGQELVLIGSPLFPRSHVTLNGAEIEIATAAHDAERIFVRSAKWNGAPLERAWLTTAELASGGTLLLEMGSEPNDWGSQPPPSGLPGPNRLLRIPRPT